MEKKRYLISLVGCDDTTYLEKELSVAEYQFLDNLSKEINENSSYNCQPKMGVRLGKNFG